LILDRRRRHLERYLEIGHILASYGWQSLLSRLGLTNLFGIRKRPSGVPPGPVQVRQSLEELGPTFVKLGQVLSTRPDIIPPNYIAELEKLQDRVPPIPFAEIRRVIEEEFAAPLKDVFAYIDEESLAAASLGQTHLATLLDGRDVVVKVQRPDIRKIIENDLEIIAGVARFLDHHLEGLKVYGLTDLAEEFSITILQELDYTREGRNGDQLKENFKDIPYVKIAATIWDYTTPRVLTMERVCGIKITDLAKLEEKGYNRCIIAANLSKAFLKMIFVDGVFHGDPHPGNLVILEGNCIGLLDYGMVGRIDRETKGYVTMLLEDYTKEDSAGFAEILLSMGTSPPDIDRKAFKFNVDRLLRQYYGAPVSEFRIGEVLSRSLRLSARYNVRLPASLGMLVKVIIGIEGIDQILDPSFNLSQEARPFALKAVMGEFSIPRLRDDLMKTLLRWKWLLVELPYHTSEVLDRMAEGSFRIVFRHEGLESSTKDLDRSANRLSFALIASATIVGSSLTLSSKVGPVWHGYPLIGIIGFGISFVFAVWLMLSIIKAGRMS